MNPKASERRLKQLSYAVTCAVGVAAVLAVLNPPALLQDLIVFASGGLAGSFLMPVVLSLYWPRMTAAGTIAGIAGGLLIHLTFTLIGYYQTGAFKPYNLLGMNPFIWDMLGSALLAITVSKIGTPPNDETIERYFGD